MTNFINFFNKTIEDCKEFITNSWHDKENWNAAIVDANDVYMGTVSLKHIKEKSAEFGITIRKCAMGKGYSTWAMKEAIKKAFVEQGLEEVYWCVSPENKRAVRFYDKNGYKRINQYLLKDISGYTKEQIDQYIWYLANKNDEVIIE